MRQLSERGPAERFFLELRALYAAAGSPPMSRIVKHGDMQRPPAMLKDATISDWLTGKSVPVDRRAFMVLTVLLEHWASSRNVGHVRRDQTLWESMRAAAQAERRLKHARLVSRPQADVTRHIRHEDDLQWLRGVQEAITASGDFTALSRDKGALRRMRQVLRTGGVTYAELGRLAGYSSETARSQLGGRRKLLPKTVSALLALVTETAQAPAARDVGERWGFPFSRYHSVPETGNAALGKPMAGKALTLDPSTPSPRRSIPPDPTTATTVADFLALLKGLKVWAGDLSLRDLEARNPGRLSRSTVSDMFKEPLRLPKHRLLHDYIIGCGASSEWQRWDWAWQRLKNEAVPVRLSNTDF